MKTSLRMALAVVALVASPTARADTVPADAQRVGNTFEWTTGITLAPLPVTVPEGWVFVLTDLDGPFQLRIFSEDDTEHPKWIHTSGASRSLQSGLLFGSAPLISANCITGCFLNFSGYLQQVQ